jgi:hypothetical protein
MCSAVTLEIPGKCHCVCGCGSGWYVERGLRLLHVGVGVCYVKILQIQNQNYNSDIQSKVSLLSPIGVGVPFLRSPLWTRAQSNLLGCVCVISIGKARDGSNMSALGGV